MAAEQGPGRMTIEEPDRFAWVALLFSSWIVGGFVLALWAISSGLATDVAASPYHLPAYAGLLTLGLWSAARLVRAVRSGAGWRRTFPDGYGTLGAGLLAAVAYLIVDLGWREGVGISPGIEESLSPSRIVLAVAVVLIAVTPLRAALILGAGRVARLASLVAAGLTLGVVAWPGAFHPAYNAWLESPTDVPRTNAELWVMDADGAGQTRLVEAHGSINLGYASWSPDGAQIGYTRFDVAEGEFGSASAAVWSVSADGIHAQPIVEGSEWYWIPRWSPDGAWVVFTQEAEGGPWMDTGPVGPGQAGGPQDPGVVGPPTVPLPNADIWRVPAAGGEPQQLTTSAGDDRAPVYSPDGGRILFDSTRDGNTELYVMDADGSNPRRLTNDAGEDWGASWSPDGTQIAFNSSRTGFMEIYVMAADGSGVRQLTDDRATNTAPTWSPDGSRIAYSSGAADIGQVWSVSAEGGDARDLSRSPGSNDQVWTGGWGPDGRIAFNRTLNGPPEGSRLVRQDLGSAAMLVSAALIAAVVVLLAATRPPFGSFALVLTVGALLAAAPTQDWRFAVAGLATGVAVDVGAWRTSSRLRSRIAGAVAGAAWVLSVGAVVLATGRLEWTPSLLLGVALACGAVGWGIGALRGGPAPASSG